MLESHEILLAGLILFVTHGAASLAGFGASAFALPFLTMLLGLDMAVPLVVMLAWATALSVTLEARKHIRWRELAFTRMKSCESGACATVFEE